MWCTIYIGSLLASLATAVSLTDFVQVKSPRYETPQRDDVIDWKVVRLPSGEIAASQLSINDDATDTGSKPTFVPDRHWADRMWPGHGHHTLPVTDGFLIGTDHGEWGGSLDLYSRDGKLLETLSTENTQFVGRLNGIIVSLHGLNHLGRRRGSINWWRQESGLFVLAGQASLDSGPLAWTTSGDAIWLLTYDWLWKVGENEASKLKRVKLGVMQPNNIVCDDKGGFWVGMAGYLLHLRNTGVSFVGDWFQRK